MQYCACGVYWSVLVLFFVGTFYRNVICWHLNSFTCWSENLTAIFRRVPRRGGGTSPVWSTDETIKRERSKCCVLQCHLWHHQIIQGTEIVELEDVNESSGNPRCLKIPQDCYRSPKRPNNTWNGCCTQPYRQSKAERPPGINGPLLGHPVSGHPGCF